MVDDRDSMSLMICRGHSKASKDTFQIFCAGWFYGKLTFESNFCTLVFVSSQI